MSELLKIEKYEEKIGAFIPVYQTGLGNITRLYLQDGSIVQLTITVRSLLARLAFYYAVDLKALRIQCGKNLNRKLYLPLPLSSELTLVPLRVRRPKFSKDGANGYVSLQQVADVMPINEHPFRSAVVLKSGRKIFSLSHCRTVSGRLRDGEYLLDRNGGFGYFSGLLPSEQLIQTIGELIKIYNRWNSEL